jgi:hypothetical protein
VDAAITGGGDWVGSPDFPEVKKYLDGFFGHHKIGARYTPFHGSEYVQEETGPIRLNQQTLSYWSRFLPSYSCSHLHDLPSIIRYCRIGNVRGRTIATSSSGGDVYRK